MIQVSGPNQSKGGHWRTNKLIALVFLLVTAGIAGFSLFMVFSRATVVVLSEQSDLSSDLIVDISAEPTGDEVFGLVQELSRTLSESFVVDEAVQVQVQVEGRVRIVSSLARSQTLVASTRLLTPDGILFRLQETVVVPAFGTVEATAKSDEPGGIDLGEETTFTIPGLNESTRQNFVVETVGELAGGYEEKRVLTEPELEKAEGELVDRLKTDLAKEMRGRADADGRRHDGELLSFELVESSADVGVGEEAESFSVTVTVRGQGVFYDRQGFEGSVSRMLRDRLPFGRGLSSADFDRDSMSVEKIDLIGRRANVRVAATGTSVLSTEAAGLDREKLVGVTPEAAVQYLETLDGVSSASVRLTPFWLQRLPTVPEHIKIEVR